MPKGLETLNPLRQSPYPEKPVPRMEDRRGIRVRRAKAEVGTGSGMVVGKRGLSPAWVVVVRKPF